MKNFQKLVCAILLMATFTSCVPYYYGNSRNHREERNHDRGERNNRDHDRGDDDGDH